VSKPIKEFSVRVNEKAFLPWDPRLGIATLVAPVAMYAAVVANNVIVATKKAKKTVLKAMKNAK
jgi:hypothetical protein